MAARPPVLVVGAGISGLTCALVLLRRGHVVRRIAREPATASVSAVAAALWLPFHAEPPERVRAWAEQGFARFLECAGDPSSGVRLRAGFELGARPGSAPWHAIPAARVRVASAGLLPAGFAVGTSFEAPVIDTSRYLDWLEQRVRELGSPLELREIPSLDGFWSEHDVVVNATGLGARELCGDRGLFPIRGQVLVVRCPGVERIALDDRDEERIAYVVPRESDCVLGGTAEIGVDRIEPDPAQSRGILERCLALEPRLARAETLATRVGLRPGRAAVRLEAESPRPGKLLVHDYGHGGAGVTLSFGCAEEVASLVEAFLASR